MTYLIEGHIFILKKNGVIVKMNWLRLEETSVLTLLYIIFLLLFLGFGLLKPIQAAPGDLDKSFSKGGMIRYPRPRADISDIAIQSDGKIILAGSALAGSHSAFALFRYKPNGSLDASFGADGKVITIFGDSRDFASAIAIQADGKIVAAGTKQAVNENSRAGKGTDFALARYNPDGSLDVTFGNNGKITTDISSSLDYAADLAIQSDGKLIVAGTFFIKDSMDKTKSYDFALVRYNTDGGLDASFGDAGKVAIPITKGKGIASTIAIQADGKIIVGGQTPLIDANWDFALARYNANGSLDTTFGHAGIVTTDFNGHHDYIDSINTVAIQEDGKILAVGQSYNPSTKKDFAIARYNANGSLDTTFGTNGKVTTDIAGDDDKASGLTIQKDKKIIVVGSTLHDSSYNFGIVRYNPDGSLDKTFGKGGKVTINFNLRSEGAATVIPQPDNKILVLGYSRYSICLARYQN